VAILNDKLERVAGQRLNNSLDEVLRMLSPYRGEIAGIAVESTFNWYWLVDGLMDAGYRLHLANTCKMKQYDGMKYKDDRHDARWLARLLALGILPVGHIYPQEERPLRDLLRRRSFLVKKRSSMLISMRGAFECRTGMRATADDIKTWTEDDLKHLLSDPDIRLGLSCLVAPIKAMTEQIEIIEKWVLPRARLRDEFRMLETVWGIGKILGLTIMYEVGDISRFEKVGNFASYCRLVKSEYLSNGKRKGKGNSKNGNPYLSWAYSEAAHFANRYRKPAQKFIQRKRKQTNGIVANRALAHKLARASYYVMRDLVEFDPTRVFGASQCELM
jgi:transposase